MKTSFRFVADKRSKFSAAAILVTALAVGAISSRPASAEASHSFTSFTAGGGFETVEGAGVSARFFNRSDVATDLYGNTYRADAGLHVIYKITADGVLTTLAGQPGRLGCSDGTGRAARFNYPNGIAVDTSGNVYVADTGNEIIRRITPDGVVTTLAGMAGTAGSSDGVNNAARFNRPYGLAITPAGTIYVADTLNCNIRKITPAGVVTTLAGSAGHLGCNDGRGPLATFNTPCSIATDVLGNVYVADNGNDSIRKITPAGTVKTLAPVRGIRTRQPTAGACYCCSKADNDLADDHACGCHQSILQSASYLHY